MGTVVEGADGVALNVEIDGPASAPVTVVLCHGWTLDGRTWSPVARALVCRPDPVRVVRPDHRGHGRSAAVDPATMTLEQLADDLAAVIERTAPSGPLVLGGHSMGGMTLMALAERHPEVYGRVVGVGLVSTASGGLAQSPLVRPFRAYAAALAGERRLRSSMRRVQRSRMGTARVQRPGLRWLLLGRNAPADAQRITFEAVGACRLETFTGFQPALSAHERDAALATFASIPTVVMVGTHDRLTPVALTRRIGDALPSAEVVVLPGAGHMVPVERVDDVAARIGVLVARRPVAV